jgi:hypothetical protein
MTKRYVWLVAMRLVVVLVLAACGKGSKPEPARLPQSSLIGILGALQESGNRIQ